VAPLIVNTKTITMNYLRNILFGIVMLVYLWYPYQMIHSQERILKEGTAYRFKTRPVDPVDAFRGRYIVLNYDNLSINYPKASETFQSGQKVFLSLDKDTSGYAFFSNIHPAAPTEGDYISAACSYTEENQVYVSVPETMQQFFLNETIAPEAERMYNQLNNLQLSGDTVHVYIDAKVFNGEILLEELYFDNQPVETYIRTNLNN
jgi:GDYXXLXY protein